MEVSLYIAWFDLGMSCKHGIFASHMHMCRPTDPAADSSSDEPRVVTIC